jgi:P27 family predicted phage terminase small subunit
MAGVKGRSGRKPKPTAVLKLTGRYRADRHQGVEPEPPTAIPSPPKILKGEALAEWDRITRMLAEAHCIAELDRGPLVAYCLEWAKYIKANNRLRIIRSMLAESTKGTKMPHPLLRISDRALANMLRICQEFGLTPAARSRLDIEAGSSTEDPLARLIREQAERRKKGATG